MDSSQSRLSLYADTKEGGTLAAESQLIDSVAIESSPSGFVRKYFSIFTVLLIYYYLLCVPLTQGRRTCFFSQQGSDLLSISTETNIALAMDNSVPKGLYAQLVLVNMDGYKAYEGTIDDMNECEYDLFPPPLLLTAPCPPCRQHCRQLL